MSEKKRQPEPIKPMAVRIPSDLRQRLRVYAARADVKLQVAIAAAVEEYLKKRGA